MTAALLVGRVEALAREKLRLEDEVKAAKQATSHAEECYSALAALLGERLTVAGHQDMLRCQRLIKIELAVDEGFALSATIDRKSILDLIFPTLRDALRLQLEVVSGHDLKRVAIARALLRYLPVPGREEP